jgi:orotate phosphoribosyltransferase
MHIGKRSSILARSGCHGRVGQLEFSGSFRTLTQRIRFLCGEVHLEGMPMARHPNLARLLEQKSLRRGNFILASGKHSSFYIDGKLTSMDPEGASAIAEAIFAEIKDLRVDAIGGMDMGATPIIGAVAYHGFRSGRPLPTFVVRKDVKGHGTMKKIEGPIPQSPGDVVIVDDVVTTGGSILEAINAVHAAGHRVILAISILDRNAGASQALSARGIPYQPLAVLDDIGVSDAPNRTSSQISIG